jgi:phosphatidate cytidylyltransferase
MNPRVLTAIFALPILVLSIVLPVLVPGAEAAKWLFVGIAAFAIGAGLFEYFSLTKRLELKGDAAAAYLGAVVLFAAFLLDAPRTMPALMTLITVFLVIFILVRQTFRFQADFSKMLGGTGVTLLGVIYVAFLGGFIVSLRVGFENPLVANLSSKLLGFFFLVVMGADTGAYYLGKSIGRHKIVPKISPGKSWEGLIGGLLLSGALAAVASYTFFAELPMKFSIPLAAVMTVIGFFGDIAESAMKRGAGAKDAASILPGHGGLLDRLDSLLFNAPILYYFAMFYFGI